MTTGSFGTVEAADALDGDTLGKISVIPLL
jgi:hypothetical protein